MVKRKSEVALADADQSKAIREKYMKTADRVSPSSDVRPVRCPRFTPPPLESVGSIKLLIFTMQITQDHHMLILELKRLYDYGYPLPLLNVLRFRNDSPAEELCRRS